MERRVLLAIFLAFLVLYVWQAAFVKPVPKPVPGTAPTTATSTSTARPATTGTSPAAPTPSTAAAATPAPATLPTAAPLVSEASERDVRVETRDVIAVFTNRGARLKSWRLKHYFDSDNQPQELIEHELPSQPLPFTLRTSNDAETATLNTALYAVTGATDAAQSAPVDLRFEYRDASGLSAVKEFHFDPASYIVSFRATIIDGDNAVKPAIEWGPAVGDFAETSRYVAKAGGLLFENDKAVRLVPKDVATKPTYDGDFTFAGVDDNYFMTVALTTGASKVSFQPVAIPPAGDSKEAPRELMSYSIEPGNGGTPMKFFVGPKDFDVLAAVSPELIKAINFGMFSVIVVPLLRSLKWVNAFVGNYGWSIILLTIIINLIMLPLKHKGVVAMRKMQEIQPEVKSIQDRYAKFKATDPQKQKMNQELMALYKERGVNPAGGCVPMLLPMPVLLAMWALLSTAIELRGAPFFGWIHDLSIHDPFYVMPILMGATQVWQQRLTPAAGADPAQQKMMMFMPVMFTAMFLWAPAGLAIYYGTTNLLNIGQQYLTNYWMGPPKIRNRGRK